VKWFLVAAVFPDDITIWLMNLTDMRRLATIIDRWVRSLTYEAEISGDHSTDGKPNRLTFQDLTKTISLDGITHKVEDPKAYEVYKEIVKAGTRPITKAAIARIVPGCRGRKKIPSLLRTLPDPVRDTVCTTRNGYHLDLSVL
jgi:hypothetical protein